MVAIRLSRSQIAAFVGNDPEAIRQIEKLILQSNDTEIDLSWISEAAGTAVAAAMEANAAVARMQELLDRAPTVAAPIEQPQTPPATEIGPLLRAVEDLQATPVQQEHVVAGQYLAVRTITVTGSPTADDCLILVDAAGGAVSVNLPPVASSARRVLTVKKIDASGNAVTIDADGGELIDGLTTQPLAAQYDALTIQCDGAAWWII